MNYNINIIIIVACESLSGYNLMGRYLIVLYFAANKVSKVNLKRKEEEIQMLREKYNVK